MKTNSAISGGDLEALAANLTKAQRLSLVEAEDMHSNHGGYPFFTARITCNPWPQGIAQFLTLNKDRLTPLGLALRHHLISREPPNAS